MLAVGDQTGDNAFYTVATWRSASFAFLSSPLKGKNITTPTMPLLMEAMRRVDELIRGSAAPVEAEKSLKDLF